MRSVQTSGLMDPPPTHLLLTQPHRTPGIGHRTQWGAGPDEGRTPPRTFSHAGCASTVSKGARSRERMRGWGPKAPSPAHCSPHPTHHQKATRRVMRPGLRMQPGPPWRGEEDPPMVIVRVSTTPAPRAAQEKKSVGSLLVRGQPCDEPCDATPDALRTGQAEEIIYLLKDREKPGGGRRRRTMTTSERGEPGGMCPPPAPPFRLRRACPPHPPPLLSSTRRKDCR
jgi:hypothetical protein